MIRAGRCTMYFLPVSLYALLCVQPISFSRAVYTSLVWNMVESLSIFPVSGEMRLGQASVLFLLAYAALSKCPTPGIGDPHIPHTVRGNVYIPPSLWSFYSSYLPSPQNYFVRY
jgi:hypothetical protein